MTALEDLYSQRIIELAANISRTRRLEHPDATASAHSKLCGSTIAIDLSLDGERITDYGHTVKACLLGQASAAIVAEHIVGATIPEIRAIARQMQAMLKAGGPPPAGQWQDLEVLEPIRDFKARHASTLLVFEAIERALVAYEAEHKGASASA